MNNKRQKATVSLKKQKGKDMNAASITKTLAKLNTESSEYSLGFKRLISLPQRVRAKYALSANIDCNWDGLKAHNMQVSFLGELTEKEFINWMKFL